MIDRIGIVACETIKREIEYQVKGQDDGVALREYLEFGLHECLEELKRAVVEKVKSL